MVVIAMVVVVVVIVHSTVACVPTLGEINDNHCEPNAMWEKLYKDIFGDEEAMITITSSVFDFRSHHSSSRSYHHDNNSNNIKNVDEIVQELLCPLNFHKS